PGHQVTVLRDRRHRGRQLADHARGDRRALSIHGRAVVGNPGDDYVRVVLHDIARQARPRAQAIEVQADTLLSGTFRMLSDPATNQSTKTPKTTGKPPGRPSRRGPALKASSRGPPMKTAMMPAPAVAMLEKPMYRPPSCGGMMSWMNAQSTLKKTPSPRPINRPVRVAWAARSGTLRPRASGESAHAGTHR